MRTSAVLTLLMLTLACGQDPQTSGGPVSEARDSAGIMIVENPSPPEGSRLGWRIGPEPDVSIGVLEGEEPYMLHWVGGATRLPDGRIVVANGGTQEVRVFDGDGQHLMTLGGEGGGPREFMSLVGVGQWPGDSIAAWYAGNLGVSIFNSKGVFARTLFLRSEQSVNWLRPWPEAVRQDGTLMSRRVLDDQGRSVVVEMWEGGGLLSASLGQHPGEEIILTTDDRGNTIITDIAYGRRLVRGLWGDLVVVSPTSSYEIRAFREDGTLDRIVRREHTPRVPVEADRAPYIEDVMVPYRAAEVPEQFVEEARRHFQSVPLAKFFPAFTSVMTDAAGHLWVEEYEFPREDRPGVLWTVFDSEGRVLGFVETPEGLRIFEIGEDYILGTMEDELEVEYVQIWPLERSEP